MSPVVRALLPLDRFGFHVPEDVRELVERLRQYTLLATEAPGNTPPVQASVWDRGFKLARTWGRGRGSVTLVASGRLEPDPAGGTRVDVLLRPELVELVLAGWFFGFVGVMFVAGVVGLHGPLVGISLAMLFVAWVVMLGRWWSRAPAWRDEVTRLVTIAGQPAPAAAGSRGKLPAEVGDHAEAARE